MKKFLTKIINKKNQKNELPSVDIAQLFKYNNKTYMVHGIDYNFRYGKPSQLIIEAEEFTKKSFIKINRIRPAKDYINAIEEENDNE